jgi:hypothetical protein
MEKEQVNDKKVNQSLKIRDNRIYEKSLKIKSLCKEKRESIYKNLYD